MVAIPRLTVFVRDDIFSISAPCSFLFGHEKRDGNKNRTYYVEDFVHMSKESASKFPVTRNCSQNENTIMKGVILGLVYNKTDFCDGDIIEILKRFHVVSTFVCVTSAKEVFRGKSLAITLPRHLQTEACNREDIDLSEKELTVVHLKQKYLTFCNLNDSFMDFDNNYSQVKGQPCRSNKAGTNQLFPPEFSTAQRIQNDVKTFFSFFSLSLQWLMSRAQSYSAGPLFLQYLVGHFIHLFYVPKQVSYRIKQIGDIFADKQTYPRHITEDSKAMTAGNVMISIIMDVFFGVLLVYIAFCHQHCLSISSWLVNQKYTVAEQLLGLLRWLMGAPAGLKLNIPLNQFLGNFYIYHVYLWTSYLYLIEYYLPTIILCCTLVGCLGVTFLLAVLCDILSLLTLHIYCFYIYAARLYSFEMQALASLLRLFTGKKWNVLRKRVDSVEYDVDRLFIGTLLFTILLFLFPTVVLYYIVFTSLHLMVLLVQSFFLGLVMFFNLFPFYSLWLYFLDSDSLPGKLVVDRKIIKSTGIVDTDKVLDGIHLVKISSFLFLSFKHECLPWTNLFKTYGRSLVEVMREIFGADLFHKLFTGQLISKSKSFESLLV